MIDVRCSPVTCNVFTVVATPTSAHGEGHIVFTIIKAAASPSPSLTPKAPASSSSQPTGVVVALAILILLMLVVASSMLAARRRR